MILSLIQWDEQEKGGHRKLYGFSVAAGIYPILVIVSDTAL